MSAGATDDYTTRRGARRLAGRANRRCPACGRRYTPARSTGRYCTGRCRVRAYRAKPDNGGTS